MSSQDHKRFKPKHGVQSVRGVSLPAPEWDAAPDRVSTAQAMIDGYRADAEAEAAIARRRTRIAEMCMAGSRGAEICTELAIPRTTLDYDLRVLGLRLRRAPAKKSKKVINEQKVALQARRDRVRDNFEAGISVQQSADALGLTTAMVRNDLFTMGLSSRANATNERRARLAKEDNGERTIAELCKILRCNHATIARDRKFLRAERARREGGA
ncbi:MAG: hypothetical protein KJP02_04550 [Octadecabacter sp.]|nr:hypothetical protein [Octadecabacter sp.]